MQSQRSNQKRVIRKKKKIELQKIFFHFSSFWPFILHQCITFLFFVQIEQFKLHQCITLSFFVQIEQFKLLHNCHLKLYKSSCNFKGNKNIFKDFFTGSKIGFELFNQNISIETTRPTSGAITFLPLIYFCQFLVQSMHKKEGSIYSLETINNGAFLQKWPKTIP